MSFIKKIVEIVENRDTIDARKNIIKIQRDIKSYKEKVKQYIDGNFVDFLPCVIQNEIVLEEGKNLDNELASLKRTLTSETKSMYQANDEISKLVEELEEENLKLNFSLKLMKIDQMLGKINSYNETQKYAEANRTISSILLLLNDPDDKIIRRLDLYKNLKQRLANEQSTVLSNLDIRFKELVQLKEKSFLKTRSIVINTTKDDAKLVECANAIVESDYDFKTFTDFFFNNVFEPIMTRAVSLEVDKAENGGIYKMSLSYSIEPITDDLRPNYAVVFTNIRHVLFYLLNMNVKLNTGEFFLAHIFQDRRSELLEHIFNKCLIHSIPTTFEEKNQCLLNADILKMSRMFLELHFFSDSPDVEGVNLEDYTKKIDKLFYEQFTRNIQISVSEVLKRDLHDMILISEDTTLSTSTPLTFPRSMISKSTLEIVALLEKIIRQGSAGGDKQKPLMQAVRAVLENYTFAVQLHHSKFMSKIPQQSALFYNNCMYLSNWVTNNSETKQFGMETVVDDLEKQGWEVLECQIAKQKIQLLEILREFDPSQSLNEIKPEHFKPIRQCLRQMDLLKNVWQTILPSDLYNKTISSLLDVISADLTKKVSLMEDISTTLSNGLVELIKTVDEKGQSLMEPDVSVYNMVPTWPKMLHLQFILDSSLVDITNSWKSGQISQSFKAEDVKRLIRALFQNTDRRANALSSIL